MPGPVNITGLWRPVTVTSSSNCPSGECKPPIGMKTLETRYDSAHCRYALRIRKFGRRSPCCLFHSTAESASGFWESRVAPDSSSRKSGLGGPPFIGTALCSLLTAAMLSSSLNSRRQGPWRGGSGVITCGLGTTISLAKVRIESFRIVALDGTCGCSVYRRGRLNTIESNRVQRESD